MPEPAGDEAEIREQIAWLHRRIYGELVTPDDEAVSETFELHLALFAEAQNAVRAWEGTVAAMLQDIRVATS